MDVCLNKPFRAILRQCWIKYVSSVPKSFLEVNSNFSCKLLVLIPQLMINSAEERFHHLVERPEIVKRSVKVCGISSSVHGKVHQCTEKTVRNVETDVEESENNPFLMIHKSLE